MEFSAPVATLLVGLIGAFIALHIARLNSWRRACVKFRESILVALTGLYPHPVNWPQNIDAHLRHVFPALSSAVEEFSRHLPKRKRAAFAQAWLEYRCSTGREIDQQCYHHYMGFSSMPEPKGVFHANVSRLLSFAEQP